MGNKDIQTLGYVMRRIDYILNNKTTTYNRIGTNMDFSREINLPMFEYIQKTNPDKIFIMKDNQVYEEVKRYGRRDRN